MHVGKLPSDVVASAAGSSAKADKGTDEGFHTARHVSLADVFTCPRRVGVSSSCWTAGVHYIVTSIETQQVTTRLIFTISLTDYLQIISVGSCCGALTQNNNNPQTLL